ncbi:pRL2-8 [Streptomyces sp. NPDC001492]
MARGPRRGDCRQCWQHAEIHKNLLGLAKEADCPGCDDHRINGCPTVMGPSGVPVSNPKKNANWW